MIGVTGLAVDYGNAIMQESKLKNATDLAALAGVQDLPYTDSAEFEMQEYFDENYSLAAATTTQMDSGADYCWITASHEVPTYFMRFFGQDTLTVKAASKAVLEPIEGMTGGKGVMPFVIINPNKNGSPNDDLDASNNGQPFVLKYGSDNIMVEDWFYGRQMVAWGNPHSEGSLPNGGWRSVLALDPNSMDPYTNENSAESFRTNFGDGWKGSVKLGDILDSNPGVMTGATTQGRSDRLDGFTSTDWSGFDVNLDSQNGRVVVVPVVSLGQYVNGVWQEATTVDIQNGNYDWQKSRVDGFATFFLLSSCEQNQLPGANLVNNKWVVGRFIYGANIGGDIRTPGNSGGPAMGMTQGRLVPFNGPEALG